MAAAALSPQKTEAKKLTQTEIHDCRRLFSPVAMSIHTNPTVHRYGRGAMLRWVVLALFISVCASAEAQKKKGKTKTQPLSRGWGKNIKWAKSYEEALSELAKSQKPLMVIHHLDNCPHSEALKEAFVADKSIQKMAKEDFIMLNVVEETGDQNLAPDGYYVPRILFVDTDSARYNTDRLQESSH
uniref:Anterior gradient 1 n=1 Tax=Fundulus heteroclitus TaxID=8078 RepID=A0A3Q2NZ91_FUNHE